MNVSRHSAPADSTVTGVDLVCCPDPDCGTPAEVRDTFLTESTDGLVEHKRIFCLSGHSFTLPSASLSPL
jgi:hypothetical protein